MKIQTKCGRLPLESNRHVGLLGQMIESDSQFMKPSVQRSFV